MKEFVVTLLHLAVLLEAWCTIAVGAQKEKILENDQDLLKGTEWEGTAKALFTCTTKSRIINGNEALNLKMECFELKEKYHRQSGEKYALKFVLGTSCNVDVFYTPSCDRKKIVKSILVHAMTDHGKCVGTYLVHNDEKDTNQASYYNIEDGSKTKIEPEKIDGFKPKGGWDYFKEDNCVDGKPKEDGGHKEDEHKGESNNQKDLEKGQKAEVHKDKDHKEVEKNKDPKDQGHQEGGQKKEEHKDPKQDQGGQKKEDPKDKKHEEGVQNKAEGAVKKTGK